MISDTPYREREADTIGSKSAQTFDTARDEAAKLGSTARQASESIARERAEEVRSHVVARTDSVETAVSDIASTLSEHSDTLGHYASELADSLSIFNDRLKTSSMNELASDARRVARDNPAMFMLGAVTVGAIAARFFQASETRTGTRIPTDQAADIRWGSDHE